MINLFSILNSFSGIFSQNNIQGQGQGQDETLDSFDDMMQDITATSMPQYAKISNNSNDNTTLQDEFLQNDTSNSNNYNYASATIIKFVSFQNISFDSGFNNGILSNIFGNLNTAQMPSNISNISTKQPSDVSKSQEGAIANTSHVTSANDANLRRLEDFLQAQSS